MSNVDVLNKDIEEQIPFESVVLPSRGELYSVEHPLYKEETADIKAMTAVEEDILTTKSLVMKGSVISVLIKSCLLNKSIDPSSLLIGDKTAILLAIRRSGFGSKYKVKTRCPSCDHLFKHNFDLNKLATKELSAKPIKEGENLFEFEMPISKKIVLFSLLTDGDEEDIAKTQESRRKAFQKQNIASEVDTNVTDRIIRQIKKFGEEEDKFKISSMVKKMPALDARKFREYVRKIEPDILLEQEVSCPSCGSYEMHDIPMGLEFLWPKL